MRNLIGYFAGLPDCTQYSVKIISNHESDEFEEIFLASERPFVVSYDTNNTPFEPIRYSRASINVVADEKFFDVFSSTAQGTKVILTNETTETIEWVGYLTSNLISMPDVSCDVETFTLEANDCLSTLDKYDYQGWTSAKTIVTFSQLLAGIANRCGQITDLYVDMSLMRENNTYVTMDDLTISEQNFYSSDTDEPWNVQDVLIELCKYLGYTAMQKGTSLYLVDLQAHTNQKWNGDEATLYFNFYHYKQENLWASFIQEVVEVPALTLRQSIIMGTGADISLETLYNKIQVKDSFYEIDHFIPDVYEDSHLTNREGDFWKCNQIAPGNYHLNYMGKNGKVKSEEKPESDHIYYIRKFDHDWYDYIYRDLTTLEEVEVTGFTASGISVSSVEANAGSSGDTGQFYELNAVFTNNDPISHNVAVTVGIGAAWYQPPYTTMRTDESERVYNFTIASGETYTGSFSAACSAGQNTLMLVYINHMNIDGGPDIEIQGGYSSLEMKYVSSCIVDLATFDKPMDTTKYLYETESDISFDRYIMIHQHDQPYRMHPHSQWLFEDAMTPLHDYEIEAVFPEIMRLSSGYTNPMIIDNKAYLALNAQAIFERYELEYKNPEWTDENTRRSFLGLFGPVHGITTIAPCLIFKLKIGDKYWSSELNQWTTTEGCFVVNLATDKADKDDVDFTAWWNKEHPVLNNLSWTDYGGLSGYKIPLDETLDFSQPIEFSMMMPSKMQKIDGDYTLAYNEMCWVKDLGIEFTTKDSENYSNADVLYENIIDSGSVNTLSDISCRITTYPGEGMHSYSNVAMDGKLINQIVRLGLDNIPNKAEENIIKSYSNMYSSPTIKENLTINLDANQMSRIYDPTIRRYFMVLGGEIDYAMGSQRLSIVQSKMWGGKDYNSISLSARWVKDIPLDGGIATSANCVVVATIHYDDGTSEEVTREARIRGSLEVSASTEEMRHSAGTLTLTAECYGLTASTNVIAYQSAFRETPLTFDFGSNNYKIAVIDELNHETQGGDEIWWETPCTIYMSVNHGEWMPITFPDNGTPSGYTYEIIYTTVYPGEYRVPTGYLIDTGVEGGVVQFKGESAVRRFYGTDLSGNSTVSYEVYGNPYSIRYGDDFAENNSAPDLGTLFFISNVENAKYISLPAKDMAGGTYQQMFDYCRNLKTAPKLPATALTQSCYEKMFADCSSLVSAPELPALTLANYCYADMFNGCSSLSAITCLAETTANNATGSHETIPVGGWVKGVSETGVFTKNSNASFWTTGITGIPSGWTVEEYTPPTPPPYVPDTYLTFNMMEDGDIVYASNSSLSSIDYSKDSGATWTTIQSSTAGTIVHVSSGDTVFFRGNKKAYVYDKIISTAKHNISGEIVSLLSGGVMTTENCFERMFSGSTGLVSAEDLILPSNTTNWCYYNMFRGCASLTTAPELPAETLSEYAYSNMFRDCSNLNYVKCDATDISARNCLSAWLSGVSSSGTFVKKSGVTYPSSDSGIPSNWTIIEE